MDIQNDQQACFLHAAPTGLCHVQSAVPSCKRVHAGWLSGHLRELSPQATHAPAAPPDEKSLLV